MRLNKILLTLLLVLTTITIAVGAFYLNYKFIGGNNFLDLLIFMYGCFMLCKADY